MNVVVDPQRAPGDVCEIVVDAIGTLRNGIRDDA